MTKGLLVPSAFGDANPSEASALAEREGEEDGESEEERRRESRRSPLKWGPTEETITSSIVSPAPATATSAGARAELAMAAAPRRF
jgi:hypothetical protein